MSARLAIAGLLLLAAFLAGLKVNDWRRDARELKRAQAAQRETARLIEINYRAGQQLVHIIERERVVTRTIKEVIREFLPPEQVAAECPRLPAGWRVLHDAAVDGVDPRTVARSDAAGPIPQEVAATVADNYGACRITAARLSACQAYVRDVVRPTGLPVDP